MKIKKAKALSGSLILLGLLGVFAGNAVAQAILKAPPAPVFTDAERHTELAKRRAAVAAKIGNDSIMILMSTEPRIYANDVDFYYRQENNLYYLTNLKQDNATLFLLPGNGSFREVLFIPKKDPAAETWTGKMYSKADAQRLSGISTVLYTDELQAFLSSLRQKQPYNSTEGVNVFNTSALFGSSGAVSKLYLLLPSSDGDSEGTREYVREVRLAATWKDVSGYKIENGEPIFTPLRLVKSPMEIRLLQHAIDITDEAHMRSMAMVGRAKMEYEVQAEVEYTYRRRNADFWGYPSIVGCGPNATTLHYEESQGPIKSGDLLLMDVGAEYDHYTADVTRTFPVNGKFSPAQAEIYQIVYDAQEAVAKATKPGATLRDVHNAGTEVVKAGLAKVGLITGANDLIPGTQTPQYRIWFMHGTSHWLGMNVHDVGGGSKMLAGSVFTNEPGVYVREDALDYFKSSPEMNAFLAKIRPAFEKYKNIGVRIEDDILVTPTGSTWMTAKLPRSIADIETFMARASKEITLSSLLKTEAPPVFAFMDSRENEPWSPFAGNEFPAGVTARSGWIQSGREIARAASEQHAD